MLVVLWRIFLTVCGTALLIVILPIQLLFVGTTHIKATSLEALALLCSIWKILPNDIIDMLSTKSNRANNNWTL